MSTKKPEFDINTLRGTGKAPDAKYLYEFELPVGSVINLGGLPYEYMGNGKVGGGTNPKHIHDPLRVFGGNLPDILKAKTGDLIGAVNLDAPATPKACGSDHAAVADRINTRNVD